MKMGMNLLSVVCRPQVHKSSYMLQKAWSSFNIHLDKILPVMAILVPDSYLFKSNHYKISNKTFALFFIEIS
jgi:hypothetical protein